VTAADDGLDEIDAWEVWAVDIKSIRAEKRHRAALRAIAWAPSAILTGCPLHG
jgi:hypothetical protein